MAVGARVIDGPIKWSRAPRARRSAFAAAVQVPKSGVLKACSGPFGLLLIVRRERKILVLNGPVLLKRLLRQCAPRQVNKGSERGDQQHKDGAKAHPYPQVT